MRDATVLMERRRTIAATLLVLALLGQCTHVAFVFPAHNAAFASNVLQFLFPLLVAAVSLYQRTFAVDTLEKRCWTALAIAFVLWSIGQALNMYLMYVPMFTFLGVRPDDAFWLLWGLPLLLAMNTTHDELDTVQWIDRAQALFFFAVLYMMVFRRPERFTLHNAYLIQNMALLLCSLLRLPRCTTARERRFFVRLTTFLFVYWALETLGEFLYERGLPTGTAVDLVWTVPMCLLIVMVQRDALLHKDQQEGTSRLITAVGRVKGLGIAALTFLTMGVSALLASHRPLLGGVCIAACFALFALRTAAREQAWDQAHDQLKRAVLQDPLTGLANRLHLRNSLETRSTPSVSNLRAALLFVDLDRFKAINDSLGHAMGDALLIQVGKRLSAAAPPDALVCRIGGDEFVVLASVANEDDAKSTGEMLLESLRPAYPLGEHLVRCTASIGVVLASVGEDVDNLIRTADQAMYRAKQLGKDRVQFFDATVLEKINSRWRLEGDLRAAVDQGAIDVAFQPILSVEGGQISGFEALARWHHPEHGPIPPIDFIPLAEDTGLILKLGAHVLAKACHQVALWNRTWGTSLSVSVNVSPKQFAEKGFIAVVLSTLDRAGLPPSLLRLEITESVLLVHEGTVRQVLTEARTHGIHISLDDFGTGYSSLSFLLNLPVDEVKVDRSFVSHMNRDPQRRALVRTVIELGHSLGKRVVAEGVETEQELSELASMGCECVQGWLISKPLLPEALEANMASIRARGARSSSRSQRALSSPVHIAAADTAWSTRQPSAEMAVEALP